MNRDATASSHLTADQLQRYATTTEPTAAEVWWAVEAHLEGCAECRDGLAAAVATANPGTVALSDRVWDRLAADIDRIPPPSHTHRTRRGWATWITPALLPRLVTTVMVVVAAVGLDMADAATGEQFPSLVLLLAPVAPLLGVAAAWSARLDPAHEVVVASARAGLDLVLRRAAVVLAVVVPVLGVAGWLVGAAPALWLLPCLAFTLAALALGEAIGLHRAATWLAVVWAVAVVGPGLVVDETPLLLGPGGLPFWAAATAVVTVMLVVRRRSYAGLASTR